METYPSCVQVCKGKSSLERLLLGGTSHTCNPRIWRTGIGSMWVFEFKVSPGWGHLKTRVRKNEKGERRREKKSHTQPGLQSDILAHMRWGNDWLCLPCEEFEGAMLTQSYLGNNFSHSAMQTLGGHLNYVQGMLLLLEMLAHFDIVHMSLICSWQPHSGKLDVLQQMNG